MYTIQYYKKEKTNKDLNDKCSNIKSVTIDLSDIKNVIYDEKLIHLISLYARINRLNIVDIDSITILNNNNINSLYIYEIINCEWMINKENFDCYEELLIKKVKELNSFISKYENSKKQGDKIKLQNKLHLFKYLMNSISSKNTIKSENVKILKLGKHIELGK